MHVIAATLNVAMGLVYVAFGTMTLADLRRGWRESGPSRLGLAWIAIMFTCGPHHLEHGFHLFAGQSTAGPLDLFAVLAGFPPGLAFFLLRAEAARGGRGDREIPGDTAWVRALPALSTSVVAVLAVYAVAAMRSAAVFEPSLISNIVIALLYVAIGGVLLGTQVRNRATSGSWSLSGLAITYVFPTCALMHLAWVTYVSVGRYAVDPHLQVIDALSIPGAVYFLWVVRGMATSRWSDWNSASGSVAGPADELPAMPLEGTPA